MRLPVFQWLVTHQWTCAHNCAGHRGVQDEEDGPSPGSILGRLTHEWLIQYTGQDKAQDTMTHRGGSLLPTWGVTEYFLQMTLKLPWEVFNWGCIAPNLHPHPHKGGPWLKFGRYMYLERKKYIFYSHWPLMVISISFQGVPRNVTSHRTINRTSDLVTNGNHICISQ